MSSNRAKLLLSLASDKPTDTRNGPRRNVPLQAVPPDTSQLGCNDKVASWLRKQPCRKRLQFSPPRKKVSNLEVVNSSQNSSLAADVPSRRSVKTRAVNITGQEPAGQAPLVQVVDLSQNSSVAQHSKKTKPVNITAEEAAGQASHEAVVNSSQNCSLEVPSQSDQSTKAERIAVVLEPAGRAPVVTVVNSSQRNFPVEVPCQPSHSTEAVQIALQEPADLNNLSGVQSSSPGSLLKPSNIAEVQKDALLFPNVQHGPNNEKGHSTAQAPATSQTPPAKELNFSSSSADKVPLNTSFSELLLPIENSAWEEDGFTPGVTVVGIQTADNVISLLEPASNAAVPSPSGVLLEVKDAALNSFVVEPADDLHDSQDSSEIQIEVVNVESHDNNFGDPANDDPTVVDITTPPANHKRTRTATPSTGSPVRKRSRNPALWKTNVRKTLTNTGQEYISSRGKLVKAKEMRRPCSCKLDCIHRMTEDERKLVKDTYWALGDHNKQWEFIRNFSTSVPTKRVVTGKRQCSRSFFFEVNGKKVTVCKKMFMATLCIWDSVIDSAYKHVNHEKGKVSTPDKRGRHPNHPKQITPEKVATVKEHVSLFPRVPSHYCRARTKREYLEKGLSIKKMARLYKSWAEQKNLPTNLIATPRQYQDIVNTNFNLGFFKPKKDQCKLCVFMSSKDNSPGLKAKYKQIYATHIKNKQMMKKIKVQDKALAEKDPTIALCSFDLQKQLSCPHTKASPFYYKTKLKVFNFTVFHSVQRLGRCYLWHEGIAKKGSDEISSAVFHHIGELVKQGYKEIIFYSDNCGGQNKNRFILGMYEFAAVHYSIKITHKFLEPGQTMMEVDSIHARIENSTEDSEIFDFDGWVEAIKNAKEEFPKYEVHCFTKGFVRTFKPLVEMQNWDKDLKRHKIKCSKVKEVQINGVEGNLVRLKYSYDGDTVTLSPNLPGRPVNLKTYKPPQAYNAAIPLPALTIAHLQELCKSRDIPELKHPFYHQLFTGCFPTDDDAASEAGSDEVEDLCVGDTLEDQIQEGERSEEEEEEDNHGLEEEEEEREKEDEEDY